MAISRHRTAFSYVQGAFSIRPRLFILCLLVSLGALSQVRNVRPGWPPPAPPSPLRHSVPEFENTHMRVFRIKLDPRQGTGMNRSGLVVCVRNCNLRVAADGRQHEIHLSDGGTIWMNVGDTLTTVANHTANESEFLFIDSKR